MRKDLERRIAAELRALDAMANDTPAAPEAKPAALVDPCPACFYRQVCTSQRQCCELRLGLVAGKPTTGLAQKPSRLATQCLQNYLLHRRRTPQ